ncbi:putative endonuclease [Chryseobacterium sp. 52]|uniref:GIY-YIG nuclease family protein n=1 Tax=Chryseobacterium sp. 52 TaxID=2035213 RepID=UPI000C42A401|nr:GIY-YIG nuclease family protein [Chryseobacterium sp. 52]PIF47127.1 putative endonuclease [Chryseobacterium sp. 52]
MENLRTKVHEACYLKMKQYFVYILKCSDGSYYTGVTHDIEVRLTQHQSGKFSESYTHKRRPVELVFFCEFNDATQAILFEKQVKGWSRKKKEAIINENWEKLKELSVCQNKSHSDNFENKKASTPPSLTN